MFVSTRQTLGENYYNKMTIKSFDIVATLRHWVRKQSYNHEKSEIGLKLREYVLKYSLLYVKTYENIIIPVVLYVCEA